MSKKKRALKALVWLGVIVAACMYFSRTIQTITTPKVKLVQATTGRIEQKISVDAKPYFPVETEITLNKAKDYPITVDKVYVKPGLLVKEGDTIFTATINDYQTKEEDLLTKYNEKSQELIDLDIKNRKNSKQSMQNDLYDLMIEKQDALNEAESKARLAAAAEGIDLTFDQTLWEAKAKQGGASSDTMALIRAAAAAREAFQTARDEFLRQLRKQENQGQRRGFQVHQRPQQAAGGNAGSQRTDGQAPGGQAGFGHGDGDQRRVHRGTGSQSR